jgi:hypothetical protein
MQALTHWDASITSTRTAVGQFKGQFKGGNGGNVTEGSKCKHSQPARPLIKNPIPPNHVHAHSSRSVQGPVQWGHGTLHGFDLARELTPDCHNTPRTVSITSGAMERYVRGFDSAQKLTSPCHDTPPTVSIPWGPWRKYPRRFKKCAHSNCRVLVHV